MAIDMNGVNISVSRTTVAFSRDGKKVDLSPGELPKVSDLLGKSARMKNFKALKPRIGEAPLWVRFNPDDTLTLVVDNRGELPFKWEEIDRLVDVFNEGVNQFKAYGYKSSGHPDDRYVPYHATEKP